MTTRKTAHLYGLSEAQLQAVADEVLLQVPEVFGVTSYGLYANRPSPGKRRNRFLASDGRVEFVDDGVSWRPLINGTIGTQPPAVSSFSVMGSGATFADQAGTIVGTGTTGADTLVGLYADKPPTVVATAFFTYTMAALDFGDAAALGLFVQDSASSKITTFMALWENLSAGMPAVLSMAIDDWSNPTTFATSISQYTVSMGLLGFWARLTDDGVNHTFEVSTNGHDWIQFFSRARDTFVPSGGDRVGFCLFTATQTPKTVNLVSWEVA